MSRYEWERGTIKLPSSVYPTFRKTVIKAWNDRQDRIYDAAVKLFEDLKASGKGKRNHDFASHKTHLLESLRQDEDFSWEVGRLVKLVEGKPKHKPKKQDLNKHPISRGAMLDLGEPEITFNDKAKTVTWDVPENNHAAERAKEHPIAIVLFRELGRVKWTRGTGGEIIGNDEYNEDSGQDYAGGGGSYVVSTYGPKTKAEREAARRISGPTSNYYSRPFQGSYGNFRRY